MPSLKTARELLCDPYFWFSLGALFVFSMSQRSNDENGNCSGGSMEFPTTNLYELESRVFTDHWSIPYKREESLGKCLIASTCLARHGKQERVG